MFRKYELHNAIPKHKETKPYCRRQQAGSFHVVPTRSVNNALFMRYSKQ